MWFDVFILVIFFSSIGIEIIKGGRAISPTKFSYLIALAAISFIFPSILSKFNIHNNYITFIFVVVVVLNVFFILSSIVASALITTALSAFLLALIIEFVPKFTPAGSHIYPLIHPFSHRVYVFIKPYIDKYISFLLNKISGLRNLDLNKVKSTLPFNSPPDIPPEQVKPTLP